MTKKGVLLVNVVVSFSLDACYLCPTHGLSE